MILIERRISTKINIELFAFTNVLLSLPLTLITGGMDVDRLILEFERKLVLQRYSANSIANYKSSARSFLDLAKRKFSHPAEIDELAVEKYVLWKSRGTGSAVLTSA